MFTFGDLFSYRPVAGGGAGGLEPPPPPPQNFWKLKNNLPKNKQLNQINGQQSVLNFDAATLLVSFLG